MDKISLENWQKSHLSELVCEYQFFQIYIEPKLTYLGWIFAWAKREDAYDVTVLESKEWLELHQIIQDSKKVLNNLFAPTLFNVAFLGNITRHCHCHIIPRYEKSPKFLGKNFPDEEFGTHYNMERINTMDKDGYATLRELLQKEYQRLAK